MGPPAAPGPLLPYMLDADTTLRDEGCALSQPAAFVAFRRRWRPLALSGSMLQYGSSCSLSVTAVSAPRSISGSRPCAISTRGRRSHLLRPQALGKPEFVNAVKNRTDEHESQTVKDLTVNDLGNVVDTVFSTITDAVSDGEDVTITGFGKFERRYSSSNAN